MLRRDHARATNPGSRQGHPLRPRTFSAGPPSTRDSRGTAGPSRRGRLWSARAGAHAFAADSRPVSAGRGVSAARTSAQLPGALAPRSRGSKLAALGPGLEALSVLKRRARLVPEPAVSEFSPNPRVLASRTLQQCRYSVAARTVKVGARTSEPHFGCLPRLPGLRPVFKRGEKSASNK